MQPWVPAAEYQHKQCVQGKIARPGKTTVEAPKNVANPKEVATQRLHAGVSVQRAASPATPPAEARQALETAGGSSQVSLLHVLRTCRSQCSSLVVLQTHPPPGKLSNTFSLPALPCRAQRPGAGMQRWLQQGRASRGAAAPASWRHRGRPL